MIAVQLDLESNFPREILIEKVSLSYESNSTGTPIKTLESNLTSQNMLSNRLQVKLHLDYKQDNTLASASVACENIKNKQPVRRTSSTRRKISPTVRSDFTNNVTLQSVLIQPGLNSIQLTSKATRTGIWVFKQVS